MYFLEEEELPLRGSTFVRMYTHPSLAVPRLRLGLRSLARRSAPRPPKQAKPVYRPPTPRVV